MEDCDYTVGGAVAAARPVIGNTLRTSGSKGESIKVSQGILKEGGKLGSEKEKEKERFTVTT